MSASVIGSPGAAATSSSRSEEHTSELQSRQYLVCRLLLENTKIHSSTDLASGAQRHAAIRAAAGGWWSRQEVPADFAKHATSTPRVALATHYCGSDLVITP